MVKKISSEKQKIGAGYIGIVLMTKEEIIIKVKSLKLPSDSYVVFGSCPMAMAGIRDANDIDLFVSPEVFASLREAGWQVRQKGLNENPLVHDVFEAHDNWNFSSYSPTLEHLLESATLVDGIPFASLEEVRKWKTATARPKDLADIKLIDKYLAALVSRQPASYRV